MENNQSDLLQEKVISYLETPSDELLTAIFSASEKLIYHFARIYGGSFCVDDLYQAGCEGIIKALKSYDAGRGVRFITYASHSIIGEIRHYVRRERRYYYPAYLDSYQEKAYEYVEDAYKDNETILTDEQIAKKLNLSEESLMPIMAAGLVHLSHLDLSQIKATSYQSFSLPIEDKLFITQLLYKLTAIQKDVIEMVFYKEMTQEEVAKELGITQKQVSRIKEKSLLTMREDITNNRYDPPKEDVMNK